MPTTESSVAVSLAALAELEDQRLREEEAERKRRRAEQVRAERERQDALRRREAAEAEAEREAAERRERDAALEKARMEARERVAADVARIEADARVRLEAENAARAHELAALRTRRETGRRRREWAISFVLAAVTCLGGAALYESKAHASRLERSASELREGQRSLVREHEDAKKTELGGLDRRRDALLARAVARHAGDAEKTVTAARSAIDESSVDHGRLRAYADALDGLEAKLDGLEKLALLERRHADLSAWAGTLRRGSTTAAADRAAKAAKATPETSEIAAYERALDQLRDTLARRPGSAGVARPDDPTPPPPAGRCAVGDPSCGLDGRPLF